MNGLAFDEQGQGDSAVVLLHGIGGGRALWAQTLPVLAAGGWHTVAVDLPGYGGSAALVPSMDGFVQGVTALIEHLGARRTVLVGHSMGGMVAQEIAARAPHLVHGLVLACTSAAFGPPGGDWQARFTAERLAPLDAGLGMAGMAAVLVPGLVSPAAAQAARDAATATMAQVPEATYRAALAAIAGFDRRAALGAIGVPTLLLAAEHDRTAPPDVMQRMAARVPDAEYTCLADAGHIAHLEQAAAFNAALLSFLQRRFALQPR